MRRVAYEIYSKNGGWAWRLRDSEEIIAYSGKTFPSSAEAWWEVDKVRTMAARLAGVDAHLEVNLDEEPSFEIARTDAKDWQLTFCSGQTLACSAKHFELSEEAEKIRERILIALIGAVKVFIIGDTPEIPPLKIGSPDPLSCLKCFIQRGKKHRELLKRTSLRIDVVGVRGKSSTVHRLAEVFTRRGHRTLAKVTGNKPHLILNGSVMPIERLGPSVTLYENIHGYREFVPVLESYSETGHRDVAIIENQAITEYTTRMVNELFVKPDIIVITNVRQDHLSTLGQDKQEIARSFARSVPKGTVVISGEQNEVLNEYMRKEVEKRGSVLKQVKIPPEHKGLLGAETVHALNLVLKEANEPLLPYEEIDSYIRSMQPRWLELDRRKVYCGSLDTGPLFNAAEVNDVESTEMIRRQLAPNEKILPFVYLREERRGRSVSFVNYLNFLYEKGYINEAWLGGRNTAPFARNIKAPTKEFRAGDDAGKVLDEMLTVGKPIILMGNTVDDFMRQMEVEISRRIRTRDDVHYAPEVDTLEMLNSISTLAYSNDA
ncbi:hypothetical protein ACSAZK_02325 [Methanosarcina sp. Mfa9]|uniref:hypothetical protein n=1 Tax=Methanosarcina sp. Mfa9 TaxID=3439063 RepID=UPI003F83EB83